MVTRSPYDVFTAPKPMAIKNAGQTVFTGESLLRYIKDHPEYSKREQCLGAGYYKDNNEPAWTLFYEAVLTAKNAAGEVMHQERVITASIPAHDGPAIYVACLASYNAGTLYGRWISLEWCTDLDELKNAINTILKGSPTPGAEEYAIHDSQALPEFLSGEYTDLEQLNDYAEVTANIDDREPYQFACEQERKVLSEDEFQATYRGHWSSTEAFAEDYYEQQGILESMDQTLVSYIDWERVWEGEFDCAGWSSKYHAGGYWIFN